MRAVGEFSLKIHQVSIIQKGKKLVSFQSFQESTPTSTLSLYSPIVYGDFPNSFPLLPNLDTEGKNHPQDRCCSQVLEG